MRTCARCSEPLAPTKRAEARYCKRFCAAKARAERRADEFRQRRVENWHSMTPEQREHARDINREASRRWRESHLEQKREINRRWSSAHRRERRDAMRRQRAANPRISIGGEIVRASEFPEEWRGLVVAVRDARAVLGIGRKQTTDG